MSTSQHNERVALVTGAASGIGRQVALQLALQEGARVYVADRDAAGAADAADAICQAGGRAQAVVVDLAEIANLPDALRAMTNTYGPPDIVVNNAGIARTIPAADYPVDHWNTTMAVNVTAPMLLIQHALPHMRKKGWGRIVNIASISGVRAGTGRLAYGTSKAALIALTRQFAIEVAESGVTVNAIAPGPIDTPMVRSVSGNGHQSSYADMIPMRRFGTPEDIAEAVLFLASARSDYITGHTLAVDGGFLASGVLVRNLFEPAPALAA
ncbi:SDR family NAD(P)-dependent oxidoreductase [Variovorax dokdonensis]|uniref:SDR family NAD(P)-dependent oxidoreductase n=1 Tax=Variovorax dokdonensis TaxID=344883 RepID=A0ABT7NAS6_9BURK|nr:SDR family NAD(P)-dependent oxidoreductase [Variovorax dokdonensis]MDM0045047.1 SDR family NAD(P)-dependent oxidoreductase [Variovorax dokdonensis]